jgi:hypothetical protein
MLKHLLSLETEPLKEAVSVFVPAKDASPEQVIDGKIGTDEWLKSLGAETAPSEDPAYERALAAQAFGSYTGATPTTPEQRKQHALLLRTPEAVRKTVGMLSAYEWSFVEHAQNIRAYIVNGLLEETKNTKPEVRLKAYKMLGEVTEVALFTHRTEVVTKDMSDEQIEAEINKRLENLTLNPDTPLVTRVDSDVDDVDD